MGGSGACEDGQAEPGALKSFAAARRNGSDGEENSVPYPIWDMRYSAAPLGLMCTQTVVGVRGMALVKAVYGATVESHAQAHKLTALH